MQVD
jgi:hypothetical protein